MRMIMHIEKRGAKRPKKIECMRPRGLGVQFNATTDFVPCSVKTKGHASATSEQIDYTKRSPQFESDHFAKNIVVTTVQIFGGERSHMDIDSYV